MPSGPKLNQKLHRQVANLRARGWSFERIAEKLGISRQRSHAIYHHARGRKRLTQKQKEIRCWRCGVVIPRRGRNLYVVRVLCLGCLAQHGATFAERLRALRVAAGLSMGALARRAGVSRGLVGLCEAGRVPKPRSLAKLVAVLGDGLA